MHPDFALKAIIQIPIAILIVILLLAFLIALRKELNGAETGHGAVHFALAVIGLCACVALFTAYVHARKTVQPGHQTPTHPVIRRGALPDLPRTP